MTTSNLTYLGFFCLLLLQLTSAAPAKDLPGYEPGVLYLPDKAIALDDGYELSIQGVLAGIVLICCGLLLGTRSVWDGTPAGRRTQGLTGFVTFGFVTWVMLANFEPASTYGTNRYTIYFIVPLVVGAVSMCFMGVTIQLYLMLIGGLGGLAFGLWILGWKADLSITSDYGRAILLTVLVVVMMVLSLHSCVWHKLGAALAGPYIFFMGLDIYFHTGFLYCITTVVDNNPNHAHRYQMYRGVYIMQACLIIAVIVFYIIQNIGHHRLYMQHGVVMGTLRDANYQYKSNWRPAYFPQMSRWRPYFPFRRNVAPVAVPPPPVAAVV